ncbi:MAG: serine hydrolase [Defluviitaleaceae bacterium]|nr:serine hydrolase [Defluviitaleaceae bacterium]
MRLLNEHLQAEHSRPSQAAYKWVRNVILVGAILAGIGIYVTPMLSFQALPKVFPTALPMKEIAELDQTQVAEMIDEIIEPFEIADPSTYDNVNFQMDSQYALLINSANGQVLFEHQADVRTYPASLTKIMTTLIGIEQGGYLDDSVTVSADFDALSQAHAMKAGFSYGEVRTLSEILHAIMLSSGAEATWSLAYHVAGNYEAFVALMNEKARELGMYDTHFVTTSGLHDENHYTTAHDMAILLQYALENPVFKAIFTAPTYELETPNSRGSTLYSTLFRVAPRTTFEGGEIMGGRTGFTTPAGRCLASLATDGTDEFILITLGAPDPDFTNHDSHILDALTIYEYFLGG